MAIDVDVEVKYEAGRVPDPDRIFFDLPDTKLALVLIGKSFDVQDGFLKKIRVAQYQPGSTRVVLEVDDVSDLIRVPAAQSLSADHRRSWAAASVANRNCEGESALHRSE